MSKDTASLILNVSGKLVLVQRERTNTDELLYSAPTVLAGQCEQVPSSLLFYITAAIEHMFFRTDSENYLTYHNFLDWF